MDKLESSAEKLKDRFRGLKGRNPLQQLRRESLSSILSSSSSPTSPTSPPSSGSALSRDPALSSWRGVARELTFSQEERNLPAIVKEQDRPNGEAARFPSDPLVDDEILESMEEQYYGEDFDPSAHILKRLPETLDQHVLHGDRQRLLSQLTVVTKRAFAAILEQQSACVREMDRVQQLRDKIDESLVTCRAGRKGLSQARQEFTDSSLGILAAYRRRQRALSLLHDLEIIRTLQRTDERVQELLSDSDFPGAIQLLLECRQVVSTYNHFTAVNQLDAKLKDTLDMTEEQLDVALAKVCVDYNSSLYERLHTAYKLLGKTQTSMDQLHMHVTSAVHNTAWNVVYGHAALVRAGTDDADLARRPYADLCAQVSPESILPCLVDLCRALWGIMSSYRKISQWHRDNVGNEGVEGDLERQYVERKLESGRMRIWQDVQAKVRGFILANDLAGLGIDAFLEIMDVIRKLIDVGHLFCGSHSDTLQESLKRQCWSYFNSYHLARLEELKMHLENEGWAQCPAKHTFRATQLVEYRHLRQKTPVMSPAKKTTNNNNNNNLGLSPFDPRYDESFEEDEEEGVGEDVGNANGEGFFSDEDEAESEEDDEELRRDFVDEERVVASDSKQQGEVETSRAAKRQVSRGSKRRHSGGMAPVLTNTSLMIMRLWGKYLHLMRALEPIASSVFVSMTQLLDYYLLVVYTVFTKNLSSELLGRCDCESLVSAVQRIEMDLILRRSVVAANANAATIGVPRSQTTPHVNKLEANSSMPISSSSHSLSPADPTNNSLDAPATQIGLVAMPNDLSHLSSASEANSAQSGLPETLFGMSERLAACESAVFLAAQFGDRLAPAMTDFLDDGEKLIDEYRQKTLGLVPLLRRPVYQSVASSSIRPDVISQMMARVAWDLKEVSSQHSQYVEVMLRDFQLFCMRLQDLRKTVHVPLDVRKVLWDLCTQCASYIFVEGFSNAKRCSNEGRALMQLDYRQFVVKLEKMTELRPVPYQEYVNAYVKAYYIPEIDLESWVQQHELIYTPKQLAALVNCVAYSNNKTKQRLNSLISEISGKIRR